VLTRARTAAPETPDCRTHPTATGTPRGVTRPNAVNRLSEVRPRWCAVMNVSGAKPAFMGRAVPPMPFADLQRPWFGPAGPRTCGDSAAQLIRACTEFPREARLERASRGCPNSAWPTSVTSEDKGPEKLRQPGGIVPWSGPTPAGAIRRDGGTVEARSLRKVGGSASFGALGVGCLVLAREPRPGEAGRSTARKVRLG